MIQINTVNKAIVAGLFNFLGILNAAIGDDVFDYSEKQQVATNAVLFVFGVYSVWKVKNGKSVSQPSVD